MRTFTGACRSNPDFWSGNSASIVIRRTLHLVANKESVRTAPSLPFDGVIPCQSGATIDKPDR